MASTSKTTKAEKVPTIPKVPKTPAPKLTVQDRKLKREQEAAAVKAKQEAAWASFDLERPAIWAKLFTKALRLELILRTHEGLDEDFRSHGNASWWFEDFSIDAWNQSFGTNAMGRTSSEKSLHPSDVDRIGADLDLGLSFVTDYFEEVERKRQEALELQRKREAARAKLTEEDIRVLGLR